MADIFIYNLTTIGGIDASSDWMIIEDTSTGETKKVAPGSLPISTATQTALDNKVDENAAITGATKTKITYDSKGLVTAGADLAASDMPTGIDAAKIGGGSVDNTEFSYLNGVTSAIQTQLNAKQGSLTLTTTGSSGAATLIGNTLNIPQYSGGGGGGVSSLEGLTGALQLVAGSGISITDNGTDTITITNTGGGGGSVAWGGITGTLSSQTDLQTALNGKVSGNSAITGATKTKVTYDSKGLVTAGDDLAASDLPTGIDATKIGAGSVDNTEFGYLNGVTSAIQTQIDAKQATITGAATTITTSNLTASRALASDGSGKVAVSSVTSAELGFVSGVTSAIQTQLDSKTNKIITANRQTASYTLVAGDADKLVEMNVEGANNLTVPASIFSAGQQILLAQYGAGQTTIVAGSGMTIRSNGGKLKLSAQYSGATLVFISGTEAYLFGDIAS
jgi:hypothetical protein